MRTTNELRFLLIIATILWLIPAVADNDDVYNFYFQKAPGPKTVIQGGNSKGNKVIGEEEVPTEEEAAIANQEGKKSEDKIQSNVLENKKIETTTPLVEEKHFEIGFGGSRPLKNENRKSGYNLDLQYNFNKYIGLGLFGIGNTYHKNQICDDNGCITQKGADNWVDGGINLTLTPFHLDLFGNRILDIGVMGGVMTARSLVRYQVSETNCYYYFGCKETFVDETKVNLHGEAFWGVGLNFYLNPTVALAAQVRVAKDPTHTFGSALLKLRL